MKIETMQDLRCQLKSLKDEILESISDAPPDAHLVVEDLLEFDLPSLDNIIQALQGKALVDREPTAEMICSFIIAQADTLREQHSKGLDTIPANAAAFQAAWKALLSTQEDKP